MGSSYENLLAVNQAPNEKKEKKRINRNWIGKSAHLILERSDDFWFYIFKWNNLHFIAHKESSFADILLYSVFFFIHCSALLPYVLNIKQPQTRYIRIYWWAISLFKLKRTRKKKYEPKNFWCFLHQKNTAFVNKPVVKMGKQPIYGSNTKKNCCWLL